MKIQTIGDDRADIWKFYSLDLADNDGEIWRPVSGSKDYVVSNLGRIKSLKKNREQILKPRLHGDYLAVSPRFDGKQRGVLVHRIVAKAFIANPDNKPQVNHIDGCKANNRVSNLEWVTRSENQLHAYKTGLQGCGEDGYQAKLTNEQVEWARNNYVYGSKDFGSVAMAKKLGVTQASLHVILTGRTYKKAGGKIHVPRSKKYISADIRREIKRLYIFRDKERGVQALARKFNISRVTVGRILRESE